MADSSIASTFAAVGQANARTGFEVQFNNLQRTLINRFNEQAEDISQSKNSATREIKSLQKESQKLVASLPLLEGYREANRNNYGQLEALQQELFDLRASIGDDNNVTADEVDEFIELRDKAATRLNNLYVLTHPDFNDGDVVQKLKKSLDELESLTPVVGTLDGDNADLTGFLTELDNKIANAISTTSNTISSVLHLETSVQKKFATVDSELLELTFEEQERRNQEIEDLKVDLGNTLRAISLSFETSNEFANVLTNSLQQPLPEKGSVLNLFT
ncbi:MAG: hypothetical protein ACFE0S_03605 [Rhodospirillales bacterium]